MLRLPLALIARFLALAATTIHAGRLLGRDWGMAVGAEGTLVPPADGTATSAPR